MSKLNTNVINVSNNTVLDLFVPVVRASLVLPEYLGFPKVKERKCLCELKNNSSSTENETKYFRFKNPVFF